jgi:hypothetical protein
MRKVLGITVLLSCVLSLSGCMIRMTGPCLGYGCPAGTGGAQQNARNVTPKAKAAVTAKNALPANSTVHSGN